MGADGLRSFVADAVAAPIERRGTGATAVVYGYWPDLDADGYQWIFRPDACAGLIPTNGDHVRVRRRRPRPASAAAASTPSTTSCAAASPALADRLAATPPPGGVRTFAGVPGYVRAPWGPGWALVGDAGYWKDPISAHGLTDALRDAELLARAIIATAAGGAAEADALDAYHQTRNRLSLPTVRRRRHDRRRCAGPTPRSPSCCCGSARP